jgi:hypothetical protein
MEDVCFPETSVDYTVLYPGKYDFITTAVRTLNRARLFPQNEAGNSSTLKMEAICSSETSLVFQRTTRCLSQKAGLFKNMWRLEMGLCISKERGDGAVLQIQTL